LKSDGVKFGKKILEEPFGVPRGAARVPGGGGRVPPGGLEDPAEIQEYSIKNLRAFDLFSSEDPAAANRLVNHFVKSCFYEMI